MYARLDGWINGPLGVQNLSFGYILNTGVSVWDELNACLR